MTRRELLQGLRRLTGSTIVTLVTRTEPRVSRECPWHGIIKVARVNGIINWSYQRAMTKRLGEIYIPHPRKWGRRILGTPIVSHGSHHYLEVMVRSVAARYYLGDMEIPAESVSPYLRVTEHPVTLRDYRLDHIESITWGGVTQGVET